MQSTVKQLLARKGEAIFSAEPTTTVFEALKLMADKGVGALLVFEQNELAGIFSERDYARKGILFGKSAHETLVREIMTQKVIGVRPEQSMSDCMALMTDKRIRHLPVMENNT